MATTTTNMALQSWDQVGDIYDHAQLAGNWSKVDQHDHTSGKGLQIPSGGIEDAAITAAKLASTPLIDTAQLVDSAVTTGKILNGTILTGDLAANAVETTNIKNDAVTTAKILDANVTTSKILDDNVTGAKVHPSVLTQRLAFSHIMGAVGGLGAGTYLHGPWGALGDAAYASGVPAIPIFPWTAADYAVTGMTTNWIVRASCGVNAAAGPAVTLRAKMATATAGTGTSGNFGIDFGSIVTGSSVEFASPAAASLSQATVAAFTPPANGLYVPVIEVSGGTTNASSVTVINYQLFVIYT